MSKKRANQKLKTAPISVALDVDEKQIVAPEWIELNRFELNIPAPTKLPLARNVF